MTALDQQNEFKDSQVARVEQDLSKYSLHDIPQSELPSQAPLNNDDQDFYNINEPFYNSIRYPLHPADSTVSTSLSTTPGEIYDSHSKMDTTANKNLGTATAAGARFNQDINNGIIHGHVHNFQNFTYIHGHIHTNDTLSLASSLAQSTSSLSKQDSDQQQTQVVDESKEAVRRRTSSHLHQNDFHSHQFSDCRHFEFLNCHDQNDSNILEDQNLKCDEDENCKPKIVEICCENNHIDGIPFTSNLPTCTDIQPDSRFFSSDVAFENCNFEDCVDLKCDLDTCDIDELYCKLCEDVEKVEEEEMSKQVIEVKEEEDHDTEKVVNETSIEPTVALGDMLPYDPHDQRHRYHHHNHINNTKRSIDEEDHDHQAHHLHHHHSHSSEIHHHHHIQLHDHVPKKQKPSDDIINFEWNFKNKQTKCEWDNCGTTTDNSFQLQNHIFENHLLNEYPNSKDEPSGTFECEWRNCDYTGDDLFGLVYHINSKHSLQTQDNEDIASIFKQRQDSKWSPNNEILTPKSETNSLLPNSPIKKNQIVANEQTKCKWLNANDDGSTIECNKQFSTAQELTDHLINDHVGSGKSEYTCLWDGCNRNSRSFNQRQKIIRHLHVHTRYKPFVCSICNHSFAVESMLEQHMRTHSGEKPYCCKICCKNFATSSSLSIHLRTHTGEKPLVCKYPGCGKRFSESSNLTKHMKTHEKLFKCDCCSKSFSKEKQLISHKAKYHS